MTKPELQREIKLLLSSKRIDNPSYEGAKQGLEKALEIIDSNQKDLSGIKELDTAQARAIAKFAVDFNNMTHNGEVFVKLGEIITGNGKKS